MDWSRYRELSDRPDYWTRWMLEETLTLLRSRASASGGEDLAETVLARLEAALAGDPLPKPDGHRGGVVTDMLALELAQHEAHWVAVVIRRAVAEGQRTSGGRRLGGFREAWDEYVRWLAGGS